jgi:hypothetical protein
MAHSYKFEGMEDFALSESEIKDIVEMFYRWEDSKFVFDQDKMAKRTYRGQHVCMWDGTHKISFSMKNIEKDFKNKQRIACNMPAPTLKVAAAMVLAHELQHANQEKLHKGEMGFYGRMQGTTKNGNPRMKQYWGRACEREARAFVEEHLNEICAYFAAPFQMRRKAATIGDNGSENREVSAVAALLKECPQVTMDDVRDELRASKILTPANVQAVLGILRKAKVNI